MALMLPLLAAGALEHSAVQAGEPPPPPLTVTIPFSGDSDTPPVSAREQAMPVIAYVHSHPNTGVRILAYAHGDLRNPTEARRLSLARAIAMRGLLMSNGVDSIRIEVRALGVPTGVTLSSAIPVIKDAPPDRVDLVVKGDAAAALMTAPKQ